MTDSELYNYLNNFNIPFDSNKSWFRIGDSFMLDSFYQCGKAIESKQKIISKCFEKDSIHTLKKYVLPINILNEHWILFVIDVKSQFIYTFNSYGRFMFSTRQDRKICLKYDEIFFTSEISKICKEKGRSINYDVNHNSRKVAGKHIKVNNVHTIQISNGLIQSLFLNGEKQLSINGLTVYDRLEAVQALIEHELIHLYMGIQDLTRKIKEGEGKMYYSPHGKLFQELVFKYFEHTDYKHNLTSGDSTNQLTKEQCYVGMNISFNDNTDKIVKGIILKCNPRRVSVQIENGTIYNVGYSNLRPYDGKVIITDNKPNLLNIRDKFHTGMTVKFTTKIGDIITGKIIKTNPKTAKIDTTTSVYTVPYSMLTLL